MAVSQEIALAFPRGTHQETFIRGVLKYAASHQRNWSYVTAPESLLLSILKLRNWHGNGVLAALNTSAEAEMATKFPVPVVNISSVLSHSPVPGVQVDNRHIGELAAAHLMEKGFRSFAYYGLRKVAYSRLRYDGFVSRLAGQAMSLTTLLVEPTFGMRGMEWREQHHALAEWLRGLRFPAALFAVTDYRARQAIDVCRQLGIAVPQQLAVLGVDNEDFMCRQAEPQLSSVARNNETEGFRAAAVLDRLMRRQTVEPVELIPPNEVVERKSTSVIAVADDRVREAIDYIARNLAEPIDVARVARHVGVSRRWLEYAFREGVRQSPHQFIRELRLKSARHLLAAEPATKICEIARRTGFSTPKQFTMAFHEWSGMSPRGYRQSVGDSSQHPSHT
jgi:LacI family transcriptional regulator